MARNNVYQSIGILSLFGFLMAMGRLITSFTTDEVAGNINSPNDPNGIESAILQHQSDVKLRVVLDTFFIAGYTALFIGLHLLLKQITKEGALIGLALGLATSFSDVAENSFLFALINGIPQGWSPNSSVYVFLWFFSFFIDSSSYIAALFFGVPLRVNSDQKRIKTLSTILILYALIGFFAYLSTVAMMIRSLFFVIGLLYAGFVFYTLDEETEI